MDNEKLKIIAVGVIITIGLLVLNQISFFGTDSKWYHVLGFCIVIFFQRNGRALLVHQPLPFREDDGGRGVGGDVGYPKRYCYRASTVLRIEPIVNNIQCWRLVPDERFTEVWELLQVSSLYLEARINLIDLSPATQYAVYLIFKLDLINSKGLYDDVLSASVFLDNRLQGAESELNERAGPTPAEKHFVCLQPSILKQMRPNDHIFKLPVKRSDGWMEMELGQFCCDENTNREVVVRLQKNDEEETRGLIVAGFDVRPP